MCQKYDCNSGSWLESEVRYTVGYVCASNSGRKGHDIELTSRTSLKDSGPRRGSLHSTLELETQGPSCQWVDILHVYMQWETGALKRYDIIPLVYIALRQSTPKPLTLSLYLGYVLTLPCVRDCGGSTAGGRHRDGVVWIGIPRNRTTTTDFDVLILDHRTRSQLNRDGPQRVRRRV